MGRRRQFPDGQWVAAWFALIMLGLAGQVFVLAAIAVGWVG